jgi:NAD(P)-dependent dehydrogenase (short-subunit alcohol dehydrogenase family)
MLNKPVALVTGANQGMGLQIAKDLVSHGFTVLVGSRNFQKGADGRKKYRRGCPRRAARCH